jgi:hypothetical protein
MGVRGSIAGLTIVVAASLALAVAGLGAPGSQDIEPNAAASAPASTA